MRRYPGAPDCHLSQLTLNRRKNMADRDTPKTHADGELRFFGLGLALALIAYEIFVLASS